MFQHASIRPSDNDYTSSGSVSTIIRSDNDVVAVAVVQQIPAISLKPAINYMCQ